MFWRMLIDKAYGLDEDANVTEALHLEVSQRTDKLLKELCGVYDLVGMEDMFDDLEDILDERPDYMPCVPEKASEKKGDKPMERSWERWTRVFEPYLEESGNKILAHWIRPLDQVKVYGVGHWSIREHIEYCHMGKSRCKNKTLAESRLI